MSDRPERLALRRAVRELRRSGLLPFTDPTAPSLVSIVVGRPVAGSWWGHPAGMLIYEVGEAVESHPDVLLLKLWRGKQTLVHRRLWPALVRIGKSRANWQTVGLDPTGLALLRQIEIYGSLRSDRSPPVFPLGSPEFRLALRDLERLAARPHPLGAHEPRCACHGGGKLGLLERTSPGRRFPGSVEAAQQALESAARGLTSERLARRAFPWDRPGRVPPSRRVSGK